MGDPEGPQIDPTKVRIGLAMICGVVVVCAVVIVLADAPFVRALMLAIGLVAVVRAFLLFRSLRRRPAG